jgi:hypothetical protein
MSRKHLSSLHADVLVVLSAHVVPSQGPPVKKLSAKILLHLNRSLHELPAILRRLFLLGTRLFDWTPVLLSSAHRTFRKLTHAEQTRFLQFLQGRRSLAILQEWLFAARGLILLCYYSQPEVMAALRYGPEKWARQRIRARQHALRQAGQIAARNEPIIVHDQNHRQPYQQLHRELRSLRDRQRRRRRRHRA